MIGGAAGSHALKNMLDERALGLFEIALRYQFYHSLALVLVVVLEKLQDRLNGPAFLLAQTGFAFLGGIVLFSGSLYFLAFAGIRPFPGSAPLGGMAFMLGWFSLAIYGLLLKQSTP